MCARVFVTGGTGFLGRHLIDNLLAHGDDVTALVRTFDRARALPDGLRTLAGDVIRPASLRAGMRGAEVVYHLAAVRQPGRRARDVARLDRVNVEGTRAVVGLVGELGVGRVVYVSDLAAYGGTGGRLIDEGAALTGDAPTAAYARSKYKAHVEAARQMQRDGLPLTIVCPGALVGPGDSGWLGRLLGRYACRRLPIMAGGATAYSFVAARDVAAGLRLAAMRGTAGQTYFLPGPALTLRQFFAEARRATGLPAPAIWLPARMARLLARALKRIRPDLAEAAHWVAGHTYLGNSAKAERELGWQAGPLAETLRTSVDWHVEQERLAQEAARAAREQAAPPEQA